MGNGPSAVRMTSRSFGTNSVTSYMYSSRRPRKRATHANHDPSYNGGGVFQSAEMMLTYHSGAFDGSEAYDATSAIGRSIVVSVTTSTGIGASWWVTTLEAGRAYDPAARPGNPAVARRPERPEAAPGTASSHRRAGAVPSRNPGVRDAPDAAACSAPRRRALTSPPL